MRAEPFEEHRAHLRAVAYRMLGSPAEADDAVQEAWLRMDRADVSDVANLRGWLTTVVARICLDMLRARSARPEQPLDDVAAQRIAAADPSTPRRRPNLPTRSAWRCSSSCRTFHLPNDSRSCCTTCSICPSPRSHRSSAARRTPRLNWRRGRDVACAASNPQPISCVSAGSLTRFCAAARDGDFDALLALLDSDVVLTVDAAAAGAATTIRGAQAVATNAQMFSANARFAEPALVDDDGRHRRRAGRTTWRWCCDSPCAGELISQITIDADPARLRRFNLAVLP